MTEERREKARASSDKAHRLVEEELKLSRALVQSIIDSMPFQFFAIGGDGTYIMQNAASRKPAGDILGKRPEDIPVDPETLAIWLDNNRRAFAGETVRGEIQFEMDGEMRHYHNIVAPIRAGGSILGIQGINIDITERVAAERALKESQARFKAIAETARDWIFCKDKNLAYTYCNPSMYKDLGLRPEEVLGKSSRDIFDESTSRQIRRMDEEIAHGRTASAELAMLVNGRKRIMNIIKVPLFDEAGSFMGLNGILRDVTDQKKMEQEMARAEKMKSIGVLAGGVAHDFNNLLLGIQANAILIRLSLPPEDENQARLAGIEALIEDGTRLTGQLLGYAKGGKYELRVLDANRVVEKTVAMFARTRKELDVHLELGANCAIEADESQVEQVLVNLYVNAWQAMPEGGDLFIGTRRSFTAAPGEGSQSGPRPFVRISVRDTGIGMDEATLSRIFDPFFTTKAKTRGTGLGLSSTDSIVKNHGGFMTVESKAGAGSTFNVFLPASGRTPEVPVAAKLEISGGSETILIVDDEEFILQTGKELVEALGYTVMTAKTGREALGIYAERGGEIDLVLLDMVMPQMRGSAVFSELRKMDPGVRVLLASGYAMEEEAAEMIRRGCLGFIQKPFTLERLSRKLRECIEKA